MFSRFKQRISLQNNWFVYLNFFSQESSASFNKGRCVFVPFCWWKVIKSRHVCFLRGQVEGRADGEAAAQLSEAAQAELLELCEENFVRLEKVNTSIFSISHGICLASTRISKVTNHIVCLCCSFRMKSLFVSLTILRILKNGRWDEQFSLHFVFVTNKTFCL